MKNRTYKDLSNEKKKLNFIRLIYGLLQNKVIIDL